MSEIKSLQEAIELADEIERYEAALKEMKEQLKTFVEKTGLPVDTGEKVWDFSISVSWEFTAENLKDLAAEILMMGHNPWEYLSLGSREINKLNLSEDILTRYGKKKEIRRFTSRKSESASIEKTA